MAYFPNQGNGGQGSQQNYSYNNGNQQVQYSSQHFSWGSSQQSNNMEPSPRQMLQQDPTLLQPMQPVLFDSAQFQQNHLALHQASMQAGMQHTQSMMNAMQANVNLLQPQIMVSQPALRPQIEYVRAPPPLQLPAPVQYQQALPPAPAQPVTHHAGRNSDYRNEVVREAKKFDTRLHRLEQSRSQDQSQLEARDRELAAARAQEQHLREQLLATEQRHSHALSEMAQSQAAQPAYAASNLDMQALQTMIDEVQRNRVSKEDIKQLVSDAVGAQLAGVAKSSDLESAASRMEKGLSKVPAGASNSQVQQIIQDELAKAVRKVSKAVPKQQRSLEAPQRTVVPETKVQYAMIDTATPGSKTQNQQAHSMSRSSLPPPTNYLRIEQPPAAAQSMRTTSVSPSHQNPESGARLAITAPKNTPVVESAIVPFKNKHHKNGRTHRDLASPKQLPPAGTLLASSALVRRSPGDDQQQLAEAKSKNNGTMALLDDFPDNASQVSTWQRQQVAPQPSKDIIPRIQQWDDGRTASTHTPLRQIQGASEEVEMSKALVKQSKDVARRSRKK
ncbi:hypothetical protein LTR09_007841 [Extremus antarcticus]|uniref:Uncharacterized protein n=1 Tax=Extremus antarcticus TaxID=702011 RepID=A0AAJ0GAS7_9PEZI|nr:hypothetical protein LTR09_007841 [Extremus antarcticus]